MKSEVKITGRQLQITRVFDAPRRVVFGWWAEADKLQQWSGCKETTQCEIEMDFRTGGSFRQKMQIAGKGEFSFTGKYDEIVVPERIAYHADFGPLVSRVVIEFFAEGERTKMVLTQEGFPDEMFVKTVSQGTLESFDKLDRLFAGQALVSHS
jgi:uncharacterized protein YndB with AHSA1/START domain